MCRTRIRISFLSIAGRIRRQKRSTQVAFKTTRNCRSSMKTGINAADARSLRRLVRIGDCAATRNHGITLRRSSSTSPVRTLFARVGARTASRKTRTSIADVAVSPRNTGIRRFPFFDSTKHLSRDRMKQLNKSDEKSDEKVNDERRTSGTFLGCAGPFRNAEGV